MTERWEALSDDAAALVTATAKAMLDAPGDVLARVDATVLGSSEALAGDPDITAETRAADRANIVRWLTATARRPGAAVGPDLTPEALEIGREIVRRGIDREVLVTAYRHGQNAFWRLWMQRLAAEAQRMEAGTETLAEALDGSARSLYAFVDDILANLAARMEREREQLVGGHLTQRRETVQLVLEGAPVTEARASARLGYDLAGRHVGLVLWHQGDPDEAGLLERVAGRLARVAGAPRAFVLPAGATTAWAWLSTGSAPDADALRAALAQEPGDVRVAVGLPSAGAAGFRRTHLQALEVQGLARRRPHAERVIRYQDVEAVVVAGADPERARRFVETTLGPLLGEREVLRETLRVHLQEQASATRAAKRLFTHRNTVLKRVARAEALLPRPWQERALAVALALELDHWLPSADGGHEDGR